LARRCGSSGDRVTADLGARTPSTPGGRRGSERSASNRGFSRSLSMRSAGSTPYFGLTSIWMAASSGTQRRSCSMRTEPT